jgi:hypothetical protein
MIWVNAIPEPRLIQISCRESTKPRDGGKRTTFITKTMPPQPYRDQAPQTYFTARPIPHEYPALLRTTSESRTVMLSIYRPCFAREFGGRPIYIDLSRDTIYFRNPISLLSFYGIEQPCQFNYSEFTNELLAIVSEERNDMEKHLKSIAINWGWGGAFTCAVLCRFQGLKEILFQNLFSTNRRRFSVNRQPYREIDLSHDVSELNEAFKKAAKDRGIASTSLVLPVIEGLPGRNILIRFPVS